MVVASIPYASADRFFGFEPQDKIIREIKKCVCILENSMVL